MPAAKAHAYGLYTLWLVLFCSAVRLLLAAIVELGNDEAYYWLYTRHLQWNYFDHPPMVALMGRLFTLNGALEHYEIFIRLGSIVGAALSTFFIYRATALFHSEKAGWYAAVLYNTSFYASMVAGMLIMPDSPQMIFWTLSLWMLARITHKSNDRTAWLLFGLSAGLCIMSKVHGAFLWSGLGLYILLHKRAWLKLPQLYFALLITLAIVSPILFWNASNDFVTYRFHSERVVVMGRGLNGATFFVEIMGQFFFNNPVNVVLTALALTAGWRLVQQQSAALLLMWIGLPLIVLLLFLSLFRTVYPHWSGPAYVSLIPVAAIFLAKKYKAAAMPGWLRWSMGALLVFSLAWPLLLRHYPGTWGSLKKATMGSGDVSLDRYGWEESGAAFGAYYRQLVSNGAIPSNTPIVCNTWWGAHIEYYFCRPQGLLMLGLGNLKDIHHYAWLNTIRYRKVNLTQALCIVPSDEWYDATVHYKKYYENISLIKAFEVKRMGLPAKVYRVYRLSGWKGVLPAVK